MNTECCEKLILLQPEGEPGLYSLRMCWSERKSPLADRHWAWEKQANSPLLDVIVNEPQTSDWDLLLEPHAIEDRNLLGVITLFIKCLQWVTHRVESFINII